MRRMGTGSARRCLSDQLFTDVYGARRTGIYLILVKPINLKEEIRSVKEAVSGENCPVVLCEKTGKISEVYGWVFLNGLKRACQVAELDADRSAAGNSGKSVVFRKISAILENKGRN